MADFVEDLMVLRNDPIMLDLSGVNSAHLAKDLKKSGIYLVGVLHHGDID